LIIFKILIDFFAQIYTIKYKVNIFFTYIQHTPHCPVKNKSGQTFAKCFTLQQILHIPSIKNMLINQCHFLKCWQEFYLQLSNLKQLASRFLHIFMKILKMYKVKYCEDNKENYITHCKRHLQPMYITKKRDLNIQK
jgi:hypothetical protein